MVVKRLVAVMTLGAVLAPATTWAAEGHPHHLALFLGGGQEEKRDGRENDKGFAAGLEYEYRFAEKWGVGGVFETLGGDTIREVSLVLPFSFHPGAGWRLFAGPGYEFTETKDKALFRLGVGYEFHLRGNWNLAPELIADNIEGGATIWLAGIAIGYGF